MNPWLNNVSTAFADSEYDCVVTTDRSKIDTVDAVVFHYVDLTMDLPKYRNSKQVWILYNVEPPPILSLNFLHGSSFDAMFNWTMSYRKDATVLATYGEAVPLSKKERATFQSKNYSKNRTKMAASVIGNCYDDGKRYRIIHELSNYIHIDQYGKCGILSCPVSNSKVCKSSDYRFRLAFENSNCRDYVSEKFWNALAEEVIPVVNWHYSNQRPPFVPPKSYINIYDFDSVAALGKYLNFVANNDEEFNSYFEWKKYYRVQTGSTSTTMCKELHQPKLDQRIKSLSGWLQNDTCTMKTWSKTIASILDRFLFDIGLM
ncbi:Glycoprotein 3-alpha-L-fucosyltransferase A [Mizuhopecten yessoensis]|uniref:Fucosyltransferase n=2 Tax=Mizuhopecten yessoensis TaxID=6573 RepID=A0A210PJU6_MIZYE|nr:Glycoprotein 3-alpha-L-fucosyltransferase A [Mizuhopecten yessoensis]